MTREERWFLLYAQIVGIQHHPKNPADERMTPEECVEAADRYLEAAESDDGR